MHKLLNSLRLCWGYRTFEYYRATRGWGCGCANCARLCASCTCLDVDFKATLNRFHKLLMRVVPQVFQSFIFLSSFRIKLKDPACAKSTTSQATYNAITEAEFDNVAPKQVELRKCVEFSASLSSYKFKGPISINFRNLQSQFVSSLSRR